VRRRQPPAWWSVLIAFVCANGAVVSFALGHVDAQWALWLGLFLVMEIEAAISREPGDTFSERSWAWFGIRPHKRAQAWRLPALAVFAVVLGAHLVTGGVFWWCGGAAVAVTGAPFGVVVIFGLVERKPS
jgi:hypothetical protein